MAEKFIARTPAATTEFTVTAVRAALVAVVPEQTMAGTLQIRSAPAAEIVGVPASVVGTPSDTGGSLTNAHGAYFAKIVAVDRHGEFSAGSTEQSDTITSGTTGSIAYTWAAGTGAAPASYRVYFGDTTNTYNRYFETTALALTVTANAGGVAFGPGNTPASTTGNANLVAATAAGLAQDGKSFDSPVLPRGITVVLSNGADRVGVVFKEV
jgi:hypothetical protein